MSAEKIIAETLLAVVAILLGAKVFGYLAEKIKQPAVLGELIGGVILGPSLLGIIQPGHNEILTFLAEIGVIILLFEVGLESNIYQLLKVGWASLFVAIIGIVAPLGLGYLYMSMSGNAPLVSVFVGATLAATSVGVTMRVLGEINKINSKEGKIILGAAVIDDILGLIILSVLVGIVEAGKVSFFNIGKISFLSILFLVITCWAGIKFAPKIYNIIKKMKAKRTFIVSALIFALFASYVASWIGLATIVGAFAAGLVLEQVEHKHHIEERLKPLSAIFVPIFFIMAGAYMDVRTLAKIEILLPIVVITIIACIGKWVAGLGAIGTGTNKTAIGVGMIPRGEVGLIFAAIGLSMGLIQAELYSMLVVVVMLTTFVTPPLLVKLMADKKTAKKA